MNLVRILAYYLLAVTMSKLFYPKIHFFTCKTKLSYLPRKIVLRIK